METRSSYFIIIYLNHGYLCSHSFHFRKLSLPFYIHITLEPGAQLFDCLFERALALDAFEGDYQDALNMVEPQLKINHFKLREKFENLRKEHENVKSNLLTFLTLIRRILIKINKNIRLLQKLYHPE